MDDGLRKQVYNNLNLRETEDLLKIWQGENPDEWDEETYAIIRSILRERLGNVPTRFSPTQSKKLHKSNRSQSNKLSEPNPTQTEKPIKSDPIRATKRINKAYIYLEAGKLNRALRACDLAIKVGPDLAAAYYYRGVVYDEMEQLEKAITDYGEAVRLDPEFEEAWDNLTSVEIDIEQEFQQSPTKRHLDLALEYAYGGKPQKALKECELARPTMPGKAIAYNYLGMILEVLDRRDRAIKAYLEAIRIHPRFYAARENLSNARVKLEEEQYRRTPKKYLDIKQNKKVELSDFKESHDLKISGNENDVPGWLYMDEKAFVLVGWPGHRNRPGRFGLDPLDGDFEAAHIEGVILRSLFTGKFRTHNSVYLLTMTLAGLYFCLPLLIWGMAILLGDTSSIIGLPLSSPYWVVGLALLINVYLSLFEDAEDDDKDNTFF